MKKGKIFATVVYFIFTFGIGVIFALTLPGYFATFTVPAEVIKNALDSGDFLTCITLTEPVGFFRRPVLHETFGKGGVILFETVTEVYDRNSSKDAASELTHGMLYKSYTGYVYGIAGRYDAYAEENNGACLIVKTGSGEEKRLPVLDFDGNGDGKNDGVSTYEQSGFLLLEIRGGDVPSLKELTLTDRTGAAVFTAAAEETLGFQSAFFDCFGDIDAYNALVAEGNGDISAERSKELIEQRNGYVDRVIKALEETEGCAVTARTEEYKAAAAEVNRRANAKAIPFVIVYFVAIYIIADFLLGTHFIIKFFSWFLFKVCKIPRKKKGAERDEVFGHDYFSAVTLGLDLKEVPEFNGSVSVKYTSKDGEEFVFSLLKEENYTATLRMKAGVYVNPFIDIDREYAPVDLPDNLEVEGYQTEKTIKIVKREG